MIDPSRITAFDVETKGKERAYALQPFRLLRGDAWLTTCAAAYWQEGEIVTDALVRPTPEQVSAWLDAVLAAGHYVACWNAPFDVAWLLAMDQLRPELGIRDKVYRVLWLDGLLLYRHSINAPRFRADGLVSLGLKPAVAKFLPEHAGYEDDIDYTDESPEGTAKLLTYNRRDSAFTLQLVCKFIAELPERVLRCALLEARCIPDVAETMIRGIKLNPQASQQLGQILEEQRREAFMRLKMNYPNDIREEVLQSPKQLAELLFQKWGLPVYKVTDTGQASTDKEVLTELALADPRVELVQTYRNATGGKAKFVDTPLESLDYNGDGFTRPQMRIFGTYTGRATYSSKQRAK